MDTVGKAKGSMPDRTLHAVQRMLSVIPSESYELGILTDRGMLLRAITAESVNAILPFLKRQNANGAHIYLRPNGPHPYTLIDDLNQQQIDQMAKNGFQPSAVVETSPGNYQTWLKHNRTLEPRLSTLAATTLAERFGGDPSSADWRHFGRLPGFTNRKPKYMNSEGRFPFVLLKSTRDEPYQCADMFFMEVSNLFQLLEEQREAVKTARRDHFARRNYSPSQRRTLASFRDSPKYTDRPAQADIAFAVFHIGIGIPESEIAEELRTHYLSRDPNESRRDAYITRTLDKARSYVNY